MLALAIRRNERTCERRSYNARIEDDISFHPRELVFDRCNFVAELRDVGA